jgi:hypothetical protein
MSRELVPSVRKQAEVKTVDPLAKARQIKAEKAAKALATKEARRANLALARAQRGKVVPRHKSFIRSCRTIWNAVQGAVVQSTTSIVGLIGCVPPLLAFWHHDAKAWVKQEKKRRKLKK